MRHFFFHFSLFYFLLSLFSVHAQWNVLNEGITGWSPQIQFVNEKAGWLTAYNSLYKTENAGQDWMTVPLNDNWDYQFFKFKNDTLAYAYAISRADYDKKYILKTVDSGLSWTESHALPANYATSGLYAVDDSVVFCAGYDHISSNSWVAKSVDQGETWIEITPPDPQNKALFRQVHFFDSSHGFIIGEQYQSVRILRTIDGGENWAYQITNEFDIIEEIMITKNASVFFTARKSKADNNYYYICLSTDTMKTWQIQHTSTFGTGPIFARDGDTIYAVISDSLSGHLYKSTDKGLNWDYKSILTGNPEQVYFGSAGKGIYVAGVDGGGDGWERFFAGNNCLFMTHDDGLSWRLNKMSYPLNDVCFIDNQVGFIAAGGWRGHGGSYGRLLTTNDGGNSWNFTPEFSEPDSPFEDVAWLGILGHCYFWDGNTGFIAEQGYPQRIFKTVDGGTSWKSVFTGSPDSLNFWFSCEEMKVTKDGVVFAAGRYSLEDIHGAGIIRSTDLGENWDLHWTLPDAEENIYYNLSSIHEISGTVWAAGSNGLIIKLEEQDPFIIKNPGTDLPLSKVFFSDIRHGWIAGGYEYEFQSVLLKTKDGGITWIKYDLGDFLINDMYFTDSLQGWAVGQDSSQQGIIAMTEDGGENWTVQVKNLPAPLTALYFKDDLGWAVGRTGLILRTDNWATWIDQKTAIKFPDRIVLKQNYPNPFNPATVISYQLAMTSEVELSIYNILGQKVITLVKKEQTAGKYSVSWDATDFTSGVYLYTLKAGNNYRQTRKLILVK